VIDIPDRGWLVIAVAGYFTAIAAAVYLVFFLW